MSRCKQDIGWGGDRTVFALPPLAKEIEFGARQEKICAISGVAPGVGCISGKVFDGLSTFLAKKIDFVQQSISCFWLLWVLVYALICFAKPTNHQTDVSALLNGTFWGMCAADLPPVIVLMGMAQIRAGLAGYHQSAENTGRPNFWRDYFGSSFTRVTCEVVVVLGLNGDRRLRHGGLLLLDRIRGLQQRTFSRPGCLQRTTTFRPTSEIALQLW
jgi:hypothetical protein